MDRRSGLLVAVALIVVGLILFAGGPNGLLAVGVALLIIFLVGAVVVRSVDSMRVLRRDVREGRYERYKASRGTAKWSRALTIGGVAGIVLAMLDEAWAAGPVAFLGIVAVTGMMGVLLASLAEVVVFGHRLPHFGWFFSDSRLEAALMLVGAAVAAALVIGRGLALAALVAAIGAMGVWLVGMAVKMTLEPLDGGRDLLPRRWFGAVSRLDVDLESHVVERTVRGVIRTSPPVPPSTLRAELIGTYKVIARVPETPNGDTTEVKYADVAAVWGPDDETPVSEVALQMPLPKLTPTMAVPNASMEWLLRVTASKPRHLDSVTDLRLIVVDPGSEALGHDSPRIRLDQMRIRAGGVVSGWVSGPWPEGTTVDLVRNVNVTAGLGTEESQVVATMPVPQGEARFELRVPSDATPSASVHALFDVFWQVRVGDEAAVAIHIVSRWVAGDQVPEAQRRRPPLPRRLLEAATLPAMIAGGMAFYMVAGGLSDTKPAPEFPRLGPIPSMPYIYDPAHPPTEGLFPTFEPFPTFIPIPRSSFDFEIPSFEFERQSFGPDFP